MKVFIVAAFIAVVTSTPLTGTTDQTQWPWQVGRLYRYELASHTLTRLQEGSSTGSAFRARFLVRVKSPGLLQVKLENPEHAVVHHVLPVDKDLPKDLEYKPLQTLVQPFEISVKGGRVLSLRLPSSLPLSEENLLKGLISALQVDLSTYRSVHHRENTYDKETKQGQFRKMETDVTGDCETLYTVLPVASEWRRELPTLSQSVKEDPIEITKTKDYGHCHHNVAYHFGIPKGAEWNGVARKNNQEQFIKRAMVSRILIDKQGPIYKAESTSTVYVHPHLYGKQKAEVHSHVRLILISFDEDKEPEWQKPEETRVVPNLLYSMSLKHIDIDDYTSSVEYNEQNAEVNEAQRQRRSVMNLNYERRHKHHLPSYINVDIPDSKEYPHPALALKDSPIQSQKLLQEIAQMLQNPNNMPKADFLSKFNILVQLISSMNYEQLTQTSRGIEVAKSSNNIVKTDMWMIYRDAVVQAGTLPAYQQIQSWIQKKKILGEEAAQVLATLANTLRFPTKETMIQFFQLAMSPEVQEQMYLNNTALIAATRFINMGHVNDKMAHSYYPAQMYGRFINRKDNFVADEILPRLRQELEQAIKNEESHKAQVYIKAIGNLGHRAILEVFAPYLEGKVPVSNYMRALMVENLKTLAHQKDEYARSVLYSILRNTAEPYEVRVAAIQAIFLAFPTSAMMQSMAQMTHDDPSVHVRAMLKNGIESAAQLKNPRYWELSRTAQAASSKLTRKNYGETYSNWLYNDFYDFENEAGIISKLSYTGSEDSLFPKSFDYAFKTKTSGWNSISATVSSVQQWIDYLRDEWWPQESTPEPKFKYSANKISEMLNIKRNKHHPLEAALYINLMNQQRYFTFNDQQLRQLPKDIKHFLLELPKGVERHCTKVFNQAQVDVVFPLAMGMPFIYKYREPTVIHFQVQAKGEVKFPTMEQRELYSSVQKEIQFTYARNLDGNIGFMDTLAKQIASVGIISKIQLHVPVKVQTEMKSNEMKLILEPLKPEQDVTFFHYSVWPYSTIQKNTLVAISQDPATKVISRDTKVNSIDTKVGQSIGNIFHLQGYSYSNDYRGFGKILYSFDFWNIVSSLYQKDLALTHYNLRYLGKQSQNKRLILTAVYDSYYNQKHAAQVPLVAAKVEDVTPNSEARRLELVKRVTAGINTAKARLVDLSATFDGPQKVEYVCTGAVGMSPIDSKIQYAFFGTKNTAAGNNQINGIGKIEKPEIRVMNFLEALQKELKTTFETDIKFGKNENGNIHIQGYSERSKEYTDSLMKRPMAKRCAEEIARNNYYQQSCHKALVMAHTPDLFKGAVTYRDVSPEFRYMVYRMYKIAEHFGFWYTDVNPLKALPDGKIDFNVRMDHLNKYMNMDLNCRYGEVQMRQVPIDKKWTVSALSMYYVPFRPYERFYNMYSSHQYTPYCTVDATKVRTFSNRTYDYKLSSAWHVVVQDMDSRRNGKQMNEDQLVVLARRPEEMKQEIYVSYRPCNGKSLEIEIKPAQGTNKPEIKVNTDAKKVSEGDPTIYWDDNSQSPLLEYYTMSDGVLIMNIWEDWFRAMYDGQRLVVLAREDRNNYRGLCGFMSGESRDDYWSPRGLVDQAELYGASYSIHEEYSEPKTKELQTKAFEQAYLPRYQYTAILRSDEEWQTANQESGESSEERWGSWNVYRTRNYEKNTDGKCEVKPQVQFYENHGEICITTTSLDACQSKCRGEGYQVKPAQVVCRPRLDKEFQEYRNQIRQGMSPKVSGVPKIRQFRVPASCKA